MSGMKKPSSEILFVAVENNLTVNKLAELLGQLRTSTLLLLTFLGFFLKDFNACKHRLQKIELDACSR